MVHISRQGRLSILSRQEWALVAVTAIWGSTFLLVHLAVRSSGPLFFVGFRFGVAGLAACILFRRSLCTITRKEVAAGASIGVVMFFGYALQTAGLQTIPSSTSAFLTALYVPLVPLLQWLVFRKRPTAMAFAGVGLALAGLVLLAGPGAFQVGLGSGEILTIVSTLPIAGEVILIGVFAGRVNLGAVTVVQLLACSILAFASAQITGEPHPAFSWSWIIPGTLLGLASCAIQLTMNWAQKIVSPTRATVIYTGEPVWGGIIGRFAGDRLPLTAIIGAVLIVVSVLVSDLRLRRTGADTRVDVGYPDPSHLTGLEEGCHEKGSVD